MSKVDARSRRPGTLKRRSHQANRFKISLNAGVTIKFGAELNRFTTGCLRSRQRMQYAVAVTEASDTLPVQQMRIDTSYLRRNVGTYTERTSGQLIDQLKGAQLEVSPRAGQQRVEIFKHRRHDKLIAMHAKKIEHCTAQSFDLRRFLRKCIGSVFG